MCEIWEVFFFKKGKLGFNVEELKDSLGIVLNVDWNIELLFIINLFCRNGDDDIEVGYWDFSEECGWLSEKRFDCE